VSCFFSQKKTLCHLINKGIHFDLFISKLCLTKNYDMNLIKTQSYFPTIFDEFFKDNWNINLTNDNFVSPSYNIKENDKEFVIELAIPGKENTDFNIEIQNKILLVSINDENKNSNYTYNRKEFGFHKFEKSFDLPISIETNKVTSYYRNGVLTIKLPKRKEYQNTAKQIVEVKN